MNFALLLCLFNWAVAFDSVPDGGEFKQFFHDNGVVSSEGYFVNGQPEGVWKNYDRSGNLVSEGSRKNLQLHGQWRFYQNGELVRSIQYLDGKKNGESVIYSPERITYEPFRNDTLQGLRRVTDAKGNLLQTTCFSAGLENGFDKRYNTYGDVSVYTFFRQGKIVFRQVANRRDKAGKKQGEWKDFYENGALWRECTYQDDCGGR